MLGKKKKGTIYLLHISFFGDVECYCLIAFTMKLSFIFISNMLHSDVAVSEAYKTGYYVIKFVIPIISIMLFVKWIA
jgi:hypothetical protein